jgi:hypothetical protein
MPVCESLQTFRTIPVVPSNAIQPEPKLKAVPCVTGRCVFPPAQALLRMTITADPIETEYKDGILHPCRAVLTQIKVKWNEIHDG